MIAALPQMPPTLCRLVAMVLASCLVLSSAGLPVSAAPLDARVIQSGHSLTDPIPKLLERLIVAAGGQPITVARSTIPGSPMEWRWEHADRSSGTDARYDIAKYDVLVITERVALSTTMPWHNTLDEALKWTEHAWTKGNRGKGAETILYASWVSLETGPGTPLNDSDPDNQMPWRDRLIKEYDDWLKIQAFVNANLPQGAPKMRMIPGPLLMARINDDLAKGEVPGLRDIKPFFRDDIHVSDLGAYAVALLHFAVIYERDPRGLPRIQGAPSSAKLDAYLRETVWTIVTSHAETGVAG